MRALPCLTFGLVVGATTSHAIDACMVGVREADGHDIAHVIGMMMDIPITSADGGVWGQSTGTYPCSSDGLAFEATALGAIPRSRTRVR